MTMVLSSDRRDTAVAARPLRGCRPRPSCTRFMRAGLALIFLAMAAGASTGQVLRSIQGTVRDAEGRPISTALVGVFDQGTGGAWETRTDAVGRFRVEGLQERRRFRVFVTRYGYASTSLDGVLPGGDLSITLRAESPRPGPLPAENSARMEERDVAEAVPTFRVAVNLVLLNVSAKDSTGRSVLNLDKSDFEVYEDGARREIQYFRKEDSPLSMVLLIDISSSMRGELLGETKRAALEFVNQSHPDDEIALVGFSDQVETFLSFTQDRNRVSEAIQGLTARGGTALYDAIARGIDEMERARYPRQAVVLFSDGKEGDSSMRFGEVERKVQSSNIILFSVGEYLLDERKLYMTGEKYYKMPRLEENYNPSWVLRQLSEASGGEAHFPLPNEPLGPIFTRIARELRDQYIIGFAPQTPVGESTFHKIDVRARDRGQSALLSVRTRKGYWAPRDSVSK